MKAKSIKVGVQGAQVQYGYNEEVLGRQYEQVRTDTKKNILPGDLVAVLRRLRVHVLRVNEIWQREWDDFFDFHEGIFKDDGSQDVRRAMEAIDRCEIKEVYFGESCHIKAKFMKYDGSYVNLETGTVDDEYDKYIEVMDILIELDPMVISYAKGSLKESAGELHDTVKNSVEGFDKLDEQKQEEVIDQWLAKKGKVTIDFEELVDPDGVAEKEASF